MNINFSTAELMSEEKRRYAEAQADRDEVYNRNVSFANSKFSGKVRCINNECDFMEIYEGMEFEINPEDVYFSHTDGCVVMFDSIRLKGVANTVDSCDFEIIF